MLTISIVREEEINDAATINSEDLEPEQPQQLAAVDNDSDLKPQVQSPSSLSQSFSGATLKLEDVRRRAALDVAVRAIRKSRSIDGVKVGVAMTMIKSTEFLRDVAEQIHHTLSLQRHLFAVAPDGPHSTAWPLVIFGSSVDLVAKASALACAKFLGRVKEIYADGNRWLGIIEDAQRSDQDYAALWDIVQKTSRILHPLQPPRGSRSIDQILAAARTRLERITPQQAFTELRDPNFPAPTVLVDIRPYQQRAEFGEIPQSLVIERNVLEWRFDPRSASRLPIADRFDLRVIIFCQEGYTSSLAAASLHDLGLLNATDIIGGYAAWKEAKLPTDSQPSTAESSAAGNSVR